MTRQAPLTIIARAASADDRDAVIALWELCGLTRPWNDPVRDFDLALSGPASDIILLRSDDRLCGAAMVGHDGHRGAVYYLGVDPAHQRRGLGRILMEAVERWLQERDIPKLNLLVRAENDAVMGFYAALGYVDQHCVSLGKRLDQD